ncbi:MAG: methyltransferase domain-containing protein [Bacteroidia bacterium]
MKILFIYEINTMFDFHKDLQRYFDYQYKTSAEYVIPFVQPFVDLNQQLRVLEIGSAEAGVLKAFTEKNHLCTGIELEEERVKNAIIMMEKEYKDGRVKFLSKNIYDIDLQADIGHKFDLIILKDVIEHIHDQDKFMSIIGDFLTPNGKIFYSFPPWQMPFGGHQQICKNKFASLLPYYHLLPAWLYKLMLKMFGETPRTIDALLEIKETGISLERFERVNKKQGFNILRKELFLFNPIYKYKFNIKVRRQAAIVAAIPVLRNFFTTCAYYLVEKNKA